MEASLGGESDTLLHELQRSLSSTSRVALHHLVAFPLKATAD